MSVVSELRAIREAALADDTLDLPIPAYKGRLWVRYGPPEDRDRLTVLVASLGLGENAPEGVDIKLVVDCAQDILVRDPDHDAASEDGLRPLDPDRPHRFDGDDPRLGEQFGFTAHTARDVARGLFVDERFPLAIAGHFARLLEWLQGIDVEWLSRAEGESEPATPAASA